MPIDVHLGEGYSALVITGPNTGGKTVALRTVGLLALMHQSGLHVPVAPGSSCPCSTTCSPTSVTSSRSPSRSRPSAATCGPSPASSRKAGEGTLVLLDELGAGTDPTEGSALAQALLDHFISAGALVVATTHYAELKTYAHNEPARAQRLGRVRPCHAGTDLPPLHRPAGHEPGLRHRRTAGPAAAPGRGCSLTALGGPAGIRVDAGLDPGDTGRHQRREARARDAEQTHAGGLARGRRGAPPGPSGTPRGSCRGTPAGRGRARGHRGRDRRDARLACTETLTDARLEQAMARIDARLATLPAGRGRRAGSRQPRWQVGDWATPSSGWAGTIAASTRREGRATLQVSGMRVDVELAELRPTTRRGWRRRRDRRPDPGADGAATSVRHRRQSSATGATGPGLGAARSSDGTGGASPASTSAAPGWTRLSSYSIAISMMRPTPAPGA